MEGASFIRRWGLLLPAVLAPMAETLVLRLAGPSDGAALAPQVSAPPPFDLFHDLRWVAVYHDSWWTLAGELAAVLVLRSLFVAWMVQRAWPSESRPSMRAAFPRVVAFEVVAAVLLLPWVVMLFGMAVTHLSYLFFAALPPVLLIALAIHRGALSQAAGHWWRWGPTWRSLVWLAGSFVVLTMAGAIVSTQPVPVAVVVAGTAGLANAWVVFALVRRIPAVPLRERRWANRLVPAVVVASFGVAVGGTSIGFAAIHAGPRNVPPLAIPRQATGHPVLEAAGFNSRTNPGRREDLPDSFVGYQFSYRGLDRRGRLVPYQPSDTLQPLAVSAARMAQEVEALYRAYRSPVTIVADSEGALVARTFILDDYRPSSKQVDLLIVLDMPVGSSSVYYPPRGTQGWGVATGWGLRGLSLLIRNLGPMEASADAPLARDLTDCRSLLAKLALSPAPRGVRQVSFRALADSVDGTYPLAPRASLYVFTAAHGTLVSEPRVEEVISAILRGEPTRHPGIGLKAARLVSALSEPWHVPSLLADLAPHSTC
jgi:hypothetical protein